MKVRFKQGLHQNLPEELEDGTIYFTTDTQAILLDTETKRIGFMSVWEDRDENGGDA